MHPPHLYLAGKQTEQDQDTVCLSMFYLLQIQDLAYSDEYGAPLLKRATVHLVVSQALSRMTAVSSAGTRHRRARWNLLGRVETLEIRSEQHGLKFPKMQCI